MNAITPAATVVGAVLALADQGYPLIPCSPADKSPLCRGGHTSATTDQAVLLEWWAQWPDALIGVPTGAASGFDALDVDPRHGGLAWLDANVGQLPVTRKHGTRSGGWHLLFRHHPGVRNSAGRVADGVDVRGEGGYIVWWPAHKQVAHDAPIAEWPDWLLLGLARQAEPGQARTMDDLRPPNIKAVTNLLPRMRNDTTVTRDTWTDVALACAGCGHALGDLDTVGQAWVAWSQRWPHAAPREDDEAKWTNDFSTRDAPLAGWPELLRHARALGADVSAEMHDLAAADFDDLDLPPAPVVEPIARTQVFDPWERALPPTFPLDALPPMLRAVVRDMHETVGADLTAVAMSHLAVAGAAIDGRTSVQVQRFGNWKESPRLWVMLVGEPSAKKTPTINEALALLRQREAAEWGPYRLLKDTWDSMPTAERGREPAKPPRYVLNDATPEKAAEILATNERGALLHLDELSGWIGGMEKYASGRGSAANRAFWLQSYQGGPYTVDRIQRGTTVVPNLSIAILGGIQPARLRTMTDLTDDGLLQRFIPVLMGKAAMSADRHPADVRRAYREHLAALLQAPPRGLLLDDAGHRTREAAFQQFHDFETSEMLGAGFASFMGKAPAFLMRLAGALHFADPAALADDCWTVSAETVERAALLMRECVIRHAAVFYSEMAAGGGASEDTRTIAGWLLTQGSDHLSPRDFVRGPRCCRRVGLFDLRRKLSVLEAGGWLLPETDSPVNAKWSLPAGLREAFAARVATERANRAKLLELIRQTADAR